MSSGDGTLERRAAQERAEHDLEEVERQVARTADLVLKADALLARRSGAGPAADERTARLRWAVERGQRSLAAQLPAEGAVTGAPAQRREAEERVGPRSEDRDPTRPR